VVLFLNLVLSDWRTGTKSSAPEIMETSDSAASRYCGGPLSGLQVMAGMERDQPKLKGSLPDLSQLLAVDELNYHR
jgi:hypothetical protein